MLTSSQNIDMAQIASETDDRLAALFESWRPIIRLTNKDDPQCHFRVGLLRLAYSYARLSVLSVGFQHTFGKASSTSEVPFLWRVSVIRCVRGIILTLYFAVPPSGEGHSIVCCRSSRDAEYVLRPSDTSEALISPTEIYLRHGPEAQSVFVTFASTFLIKVRIQHALRVIYI